MTDLTETQSRGDAREERPSDRDPHVEPAVVEDLDLPDEEPANLLGGRCTLPNVGVWVTGITWVNA